MKTFHSRFFQIHKKFLYFIRRMLGYTLEDKDENEIREKTLDLEKS